MKPPQKKKYQLIPIFYNIAEKITRVSFMRHYTHILYVVLINEYIEKKH